MTSTDPQQALATMSPEMVAALHHVHEGHAHHVDGREITSLIHRGLIECDLYGCVVITSLGGQVRDHLREQA